MIMNLATSLAAWIAFWIIVFGIFFLLLKRGITYTKRYGITIGLFLLSTFFTLAFFDLNIWREADISFLSVLVVVPIYLLTVLLYWRSRRWKKPMLLKKYPWQGFL